MGPGEMSNEQQRATERLLQASRQNSVEDSGPGGRGARESTIGGAPKGGAQSGAQGGAQCGAQAEHEERWRAECLAQAEHESFDRESNPGVYCLSFKVL